VAKKNKKNTPVIRRRKVVDRANDERLTAEDIGHFKEILLVKRREIVGSVNEMEEDSLRQSMLVASGDLSSMPIHMADLGTDTYLQEFSLGLMDSERKLLMEIDEALARIANGTYGICEGTSKPIPKTRLDAKPWARYSMEYEEKIEKGFMPRGG
jgi:RNA polymerase-binding protein DksA